MNINARLRALPTSEGARCTGHCCRRLSLPVGPDRLATMNVSDGGTIKAMLECVGSEVMPRGGWYVGHTSHKRWWYRCNNLTAEGDCGIYETRPAMCSGYPYGKRCGQEGCTSVQAIDEPWGSMHSVVVTPPFLGRERLVVVPHAG